MIREGKPLNVNTASALTTRFCSGLGLLQMWYLVVHGLKKQLVFPIVAL
jgi:hypothetical protein